MYTVWLFICNDVTNLTLIGIIFAILNASVAPIIAMGPQLPFRQILATIPSQVLWSCSNLFLFNLHNQRHGIAEDTLNKPWRPLPSGRLTPEEATLIMYFMYPVTIIIALKCGGLAPCLLEMVFCLWHNEWGGGENAILKNLINGFGIPCLIAGPLEIATGRSIFSGQGKSAIWLSIIAAAIATTSHIQDFRDVEGDGAVGRRTIPLVIGDTNARLLASLGVVIFTYLSCWFWESGWREIANLFLNRTREGDDFSFKRLWFLWMLGLFSLPVFMFHFVTR
ncbi:UbiA prenyltransferase family [Hypomontagnella monticulosa]|nr:UbiA prenyltransferase family [Hypomontagnella monticulosa]